MPLVSLILPLVVGQGPISLRFMPPIGKTVRYSLTMNMNQVIPQVGPIKQMTSFVMTMKPTSRAGSVTTVQSSLTNGKSVVPPSKMGKGGTTKIPDIGMISRMGTNYKVIDMKPANSSSGASVASASQMMNGMSGVTFPEHPVKVGDTWKVDLDFSKMAGAMPMSGMTMTGKIPFTMKLAKATATTATITISISGSASVSAQGQTIPFKITGGGTADFDRATGLTKSMTMTMNNKISMGAQSMTQQIVQTMKRL